MTVEIVLCIAIAAAFFAALGFGAGLYVLREQRAWRREDGEWKTHYGNRFTALEQRLVGATLTAMPAQIQPTFTGRESGQSPEPDYGEATEQAARATWAPPTSRRKR